MIDTGLILDVEDPVRRFARPAGTDVDRGRDRHGGGGGPRGPARLGGDRTRGPRGRRPWAADEVAARADDLARLTPQEMGTAPSCSTS
jgi:hypothetical protein